MLTVEECLTTLHTLNETASTDSIVVSNIWDRRFISDVAGYVDQGKAISTAQGDIAIKLISKYRHILVSCGLYDADIGMLLITPVYRIAPYQSTYLPREVRWAGNNKLAFRFKFNGPIKDDIKKLEGVNHFTGSSKPWFDRSNKLWIVDVNSGNYQSVMNFIQRYGFKVDSTVEQYFLAIVNSIGRPSTIEVVDENIVVVSHNDDFLDAWLQLIGPLEAFDA